MADDPSPWIDIIRDKGVAAGIGAAVTAAGMIIKNRVTLATLTERLDNSDRLNVEMKVNQKEMQNDISEMKGDIKVILARLER